MLERYRRKLVLSSMFGCLACLAVASVVTADGRVFLLDLRNSSDGRGVGEAELACGEQRARLASAEELRHAVDECSFAVCTRGWLYGGTVGTTVCNKVGGALKAVGVRTDNVTEDIDHLDAFLLSRTTDVPCGDPPSFPNTRLQGHSGFQMGDELLYTCLPGYLMPSGHSVFSLLCDSCGEWYGLVQLCIKDEAETPVDYEDKFTDTYGGEEEEEEGPEEAQGGEVYEEVQGEEPRAEEQQQEEEAVFHVAEGGEEHGEEEEEDTGGVVAEGEEVEEVAGTVPAATATEQPVSLLSQKHLFWFPSEAFQEEEGPGAAAAAPTRLPATPPTTTTTTPPEAGENRVRASGSQSEESKEYDGGQYQRPAELDHDHVSRERDGDSEQDRDADDSRPDERNDSHYDDLDVYGDGRRDDHTDATRLHEDDEDEDGDRVTHHIVPSKREEEVVVPPRRRIYEDSDEGHDDHYDMGEHEDERRPRHREGHDGDDRGHDDDRDDASEEDQSEEQVVYDEHPGGQEENPDHRDSQEHFDHDRDHDDHGDPDDHDDDVDHHHHVVLPVDRHHVVVPPATAEPQTVTTGQTPSTTDDTWLDGYAVITDEAEKGGSTQEEEEEEEGPAAEEQEEAGVVAGRATDSPNEVVMEVSRPVPYTTGLPDGVPAALSTPEPVAEQGRGAQEVLPGLVPTSAGPSSETSERPPTYPDYDYDIAYPVAPTTRPWEEDELTEGPFLPDHQGPAAPTAYDPDVVTGLWGGSGGAAGGGGAGGGGAGEHNLTGLAGERGEVEGERGESGPHPPPPPPSASGRGPAVAAVIVAVCAVAAAAAVGAWCYRRRQQKSSVYEMNGKNKGQSHSRHGQQIEMQQKV